MNEAAANIPSEGERREKNERDESDISTLPFRENTIRPLHRSNRQPIVSP